MARELHDLTSWADFTKINLRFDCVEVNCEEQSARVKHEARVGDKWVFDELELWGADDSAPANYLSSFSRTAEEGIFLECDFFFCVLKEADDLEEIPVCFEEAGLVDLIGGDSFIGRKIDSPPFFFEWGPGSIDEVFLHIFLGVSW